MPLPSLTISDFQGSLLVNWQTQRFSQYINEFYATYVRQCIGDEAYALIVADTIGLQKWTDLLEGVTYTNPITKKGAVNDGVLRAVKHFIFANFVRDDFVPTNAGKTKPLFENSERQPGEENHRLTQARYNNGVSLQSMVLSFVNAYRNFTNDIIGFVDNGGNSYTVQTGSTLYLYDDDKVTINGIKYTVSNVVENSSFDIVSTDVSVFEGVYIHQPFESVCVGNLTPII